MRRNLQHGWMVGRATPRRGQHRHNDVHEVHACAMPVLRQGAASSWKAAKVPHHTLCGCTSTVQGCVILAVRGSCGPRSPPLSASSAHASCAMERQRSPARQPHAGEAHTCGGEICATNTCSSSPVAVVFCVSEPCGALRPVSSPMNCRMARLPNSWSMSNSLRFCPAPSACRLPFRIAPRLCRRLAALEAKRNSPAAPAPFSCQSDRHSGCWLVQFAPLLIEECICGPLCMRARSGSTCGHAASLQGALAPAALAQLSRGPHRQRAS